MRAHGVNLIYTSVLGTISAYHGYRAAVLFAKMIVYEQHTTHVCTEYGRGILGKSKPHEQSVRVGRVGQLMRAHSCSERTAAQWDADNDSGMNRLAA